MKKIVKKPKRVVAATKAKKVAPVKKTAKPAPPKSAAKGKQPDKKTPMKKSAPEKKPTEAVKLKKAVAEPVAAKKEESKAATPPPVATTPATKAAIKEKVQEKVVVASKKPEAPSAKAPTTKAPAASASAKVGAPIKVEPKIIETPQLEYRKPDLDGELFSPEELETFRDLLNIERNKILAKARRAMEDGGIQIDKNEMMDEVDQASAMVEQNLMFRLLDRDRKLLGEIDHALQKIDTGEFGYCEGTGEPIPKRRLELRPWCRHSVKFKEKLERMKKSGRGVADEDEI